MGSDISSLINQGNFKLKPLLAGQLHQVDGSGQASRPAAYEQDIKRDGFVLSHGAPHLPTILCNLEDKSPGVANRSRKLFTYPWVMYSSVS